MREFRPLAYAVYPRVCGGTLRIPNRPHPAAGLSPRVRGNPIAAGRRIAIARSIPACAGEPMIRRVVCRGMPVYPRVCGGTRRRQFHCGHHGGLSPRVRGNPVVATENRTKYRSIPACAGEPPLARLSIPAVRVYPRVCGGTRYVEGAIAGLLGLSPRVRGNRMRARVHMPWEGSIPACAGEPLDNPQFCRRQQVYPRVCGGTFSPALPLSTSAGLSPRVRGNPSLFR